MGFYDSYILPYATHLTMNRKDLAAERAAFVPLARGRVLEIGIGSGLNFPFYGASVDKLFALDPSAVLRRMAEAAEATSWAFTTATSFPTSPIWL